VTTAPVTTITDIARLESDPGELWGFGLEAPSPGLESDAYAFDVLGWALGRRVPVTSLELLEAERLLWRVQPTIERPELSASYPEAAITGAAGFFAVVNSLNLEREFEVLARVRLEDKSRVPLATIRGRREAIASDFEPRIDPLMVTTLGRTGSTILMKVLATHPSIVAYRPFEQEPRVTTYWLDVMRSLADPVSYRRQVNPAGTMHPAWWVGTSPPFPRRLNDAALTRWLGADALRDIAGFCQQRIEALYAQVASEQGGESPAFFAEKLRPDQTPGLVWELYPRAREVILVRDFRDMVASMFAYNAKRGREGFRRDAFASDADYVTSEVKSSVRALATAWERRRDVAHLVRYEDLVLEPGPTIEKLLSYLGLDASGRAVDDLTAALRAQGPETEWHRTTEDPQASIGRWKRDLGPGAREACERALAPELQAFGYATDGVTA
jgi:sulfotransferase family protein